MLPPPSPVALERGDTFAVRSPLGMARQVGGRMLAPGTAREETYRRQVKGSRFEAR